MRKVNRGNELDKRLSEYVEIVQTYKEYLNRERECLEALSKSIDTSQKIILEEDARELREMICGYKDMIIHYRRLLNYNNKFKKKTIK